LKTNKGTIQKQTMNINFDIWRNTRSIYSKYLQSYSLEQLNKIPTGFSNNLMWNIGHVIVVQQRLVYDLSGLKMNISEDLFLKFKPGTRPENAEPIETLELFKELLISPMDQTISDFESGNFNTYSPLTTSKGFHLANTTDAIIYNNYHEAMHLGTMISISKFLS
tara:strand:+ start:580 stop:1074 length:495 start_codon:yes stop_codon:yes gene_type:complete